MCGICDKTIKAILASSYPGKEIATFEDVELFDEAGNGRLWINSAASLGNSPDNLRTVYVGKLHITLSFNLNAGNHRFWLRKYQSAGAIIKDVIKKNNYFSSYAQPIAAGFNQINEYDYVYDNPLCIFQYTQSDAISNLSYQFIGKKIVFTTDI